MIEAWRQHPGKPQEAADLAGVGHRTIKKAWREGWPEKGFGPIKEVFEREQQRARARLMSEIAARRDQTMAEKEKAIEHAARARAQEGQLVDLARVSCLQALANARALVQPTKDLADRLQKQILEAAGKPSKDSKGLTIQTSLGLLQKVANLQGKILSNARIAMEMERLHLGEPTQTVNVITTQSEMTLDEASARIQMANRALESARRSGGLTVIDGGIDEPVIGKVVSKGLKPT
jgi:hypothetical protein